PLLRNRRTRWIRNQIRRIGLEHVAVDHNLIIRTDKNRAPQRPLAQIESDLHTVRIPHADRTARTILQQPEFLGSASIHPQRPLDLVDPVRSPIGHLTTGIGAPLHPAELQLSIVRALRRLRLPRVPIVTLRDRLLRQALIPPRRGIIKTVYQPKLAESAITNEFTRKPVHLHGPLL